ncbi:MAG: DUF1549 and DUF1553 domain-containing protein [Myxococcota bacterium]
MSRTRRTSGPWWQSPTSWIGLLIGAMMGCSAADSSTLRPTPTVSAEASGPHAPLDPLDATIAEHWHAAGVTPAAPANDTEFLRRVTLDLIGRIPTPDEVDRFMTSDDPRKRAALVDDLLARDAFAEHWADVLTQTLLGGAVQERRRLREGLHTWIEDELHEGRGWDEMTTTMLTASGDTSPPGAAAFMAVHGRKNQVEALTGQTARVFLGLQLQCAQCHDDPDDRFTQDQFYGLAAYYAQTRVRQTKVDGVRVPRIIDKRRGQMRMPTETDAPGDRSGPRVTPSFPALDVGPRPDETRRQTLARGVVGSPLFAKAAVNHAWAQLMGRGIVEPWDDLGALQGTEHPPLLEHLAADLVAHDHDLRHLLRQIVLSSAYQRSSQSEAEGAAARTQAFAQAAVRPMSTDQLLRSLLVATGLQDVQGRAFRREVQTRRQRISKEYALVFDDDEMASADTLRGNVPQALLLLNGELTNQGVAARAGAVARILRDHPEPSARLDALFVRVFGRPPSAERRAELLTFVDGRDHDPEAYEDLMHAMLVSSEFLTIH